MSFAGSDAVVDMAELEGRLVVAAEAMGDGNQPAIAAMPARLARVTDVAAMRIRGWGREIVG